MRATSPVPYRASARLRAGGLALAPVLTFRRRRAGLFAGATAVLLQLIVGMIGFQSISRF